MSDPQSAPSLGKRVGEFLILGLYLAFDVAEGWHRSHLWALVAALIGIAALLLLDGGFSRKAVLRTLMLSFLGCVMIYTFAPLSLPDETETHGWLLPASKSIPSNIGCDVEMLQRERPSGMLFLFGKAGAWEPPGLGKRPVLTVGSCAAMSIEPAEEGLLFNAEIFDGDNELVARIEDNEFHLIPGKFAYQRRSEDHSEDRKLFRRPAEGTEYLPRCENGNGISGVQRRSIIESQRERQSLALPVRA